MKSVNLVSLMDIIHDLAEAQYEMYLRNLGINIRREELEDLNGLVDIMRQHSLKISNGFFIGFKINQISKEFDLLRFGNNEIVNIELKNTSNEVKMKKQLIHNQHYLRSISSRIYSFTYVSSTNQLFHLNESGELIESQFDYLITILNLQQLKSIQDINELFDPTEYLISPFNSTEKFINGEYFLTDHQENIKKDILVHLHSERYEILNITGAAGTGKTLVTYDIAKESNQSRKVLVVHCAKLNEGQRLLIEKYKWDIISIRDLNVLSLKNFELIVVDEAQRISTDQLNLVVDYVKILNIKCIFSFDAIQRISSRELNNEAPEIIQKESTQQRFRLKNRIRTNKEIASFVLKMFNLTQEHLVEKYENIELHYYKDYVNVRSYLNNLVTEGWKVINYTGSIFSDKHVFFDIYQESNNPTVHDILGQEFDFVVAVLDKHFFYKNNRLEAYGITNGPDYHMSKMLLQILTRSRKKIKLVILDNPEVFSTCLNILNKSEAVIEV